MNEIFDTVWSEYNAFYYNNVPFDGNDSIWSSKDICDDNNN